jgi:hypothetical protein
MRLRFSHRGACINLVTATVPVPRKEAGYLAGLSRQAIPDLVSHRDVCIASSTGGQYH